MKPSPYLEDKMKRANSYCHMQVVFVDMVSYSRRKSFAQVKVIDAFMQSIETALLHIASQYVAYAQQSEVHIRRDVVVLPSGDGAAIAFPFDGIRDMHLTFACELLRIVDRANKNITCEAFREQGWCDCHSGFLLRCGISEGKLILYKDLNANFNIAGDTVNMAARVMDLADAGQIFLTKEACVQLVDLGSRLESQFKPYYQVRIKHDVRIDVYQYIDGSWPGLDVSPRAGLELADDGQIGADEKLASGSTSQRTQEIGLKPTEQGLSDSGPQRKPPRKLRDRLVTIPTGEFLMGNEKTSRVVIELPAPFLIDRYPITQEDYVNVIGRNPSKFVGAQLPVDSVSWLDAVAFCNRLSELSGLEPAYDLSSKETTTNFKANGYRLPTEAEWEYCCRAGIQDERYGPINDVAWYSGNSEGNSHDVGTKRANAFGLHDMLGNVWEWCNDWYQRRYPKDRQINYVGANTGFEKILRGGSWSDLPDCIRASFRHRKSPLSSESTQGFRVILPVSK